MEKFSKEELNFMRHTRAIVDPDPSLDGVIWELRVVPEGSENDGELRGVLINLLNKAENVSIITDSQLVMNIVFVVAPNTVNPMDALDPEIARLVDARLVKLKRDMRE